MPGTARLRTQFSFQAQGRLQGPEPSDAALSIQEGSSGVIQVADAAVDTGISAPGISTITGLFIQADQAISVKLGATGSNVAFTLSANMPLSMLGVSLSAVSISNASGFTANVAYTITG